MATAESPPPIAAAPSLSGGRIAQRALLAALAAAAATAVVRAIAVSALGIPQPDFWPLTVGPVLTSSIVGAIGAGLVLALLTRFVRRPIRAFQLVAAIACVASLLGPVSLLGRFPGADIGAIAVLALMHIVVATVSVAFLTTGRRDMDR